MRNVGTFEIIVALVFAWGVVELLRGYWQILIAVSAVVALVYVVFKFGGKTESKPEYEVRQSTPKLPPMPYSNAESKPVTVDNRALLGKIPSDVRSMLWFADECNLSSTRKIQTPFFTLEVGGRGEPSLIDKRLPIGNVVKPAPKLPHYPAYDVLNPDERATYLNWLHDIDEPIEIGYVFIFYYGLERKLLHYATFQNAAEMILRLREHHRNEPFLAYSGVALMTMTAINGRRDLFERTLASSSWLTPVALAVLTFSESKLNSEALMSLSGRVGFTNKRYIKNEPELFREMVDEILIENVGEEFFPLDKKFLDDCPQIPEMIFANTSLNVEAVTVPDITQNVVFRDTVLAILAEAHARVKSELKLKRKAGL